MTAPALRHPYSFDLPSRLVRHLELLGEVVEVSPRKGVPGHVVRGALCVVLEGVVLARHEPEPSARVAELLFAGDAVGETLESPDLRLSLYGLGRARIVVLRSDAVDELLSSVPPAGVWLAAALCVRVQRAEHRRLNLTSHDVRSRLAAYLTEWSLATGEAALHRPADGGLSQSALGDLVGASRASVNRELKSLIIRGVLRGGPSGVTVVDLEDLARHARGTHPYLHNVSPMRPAYEALASVGA